MLTTKNFSTYWPKQLLTAIVFSTLTLSAIETSQAQIPDLEEEPPAETDPASPEPRDPTVDDQSPNQNTTDEPSIPPQQQETQVPTKQPTKKESIPQQEQVNQDDIPNEYYLGPGDTIQVNVFGEEQFQGKQQILLDGTIALPLVGSVNVADLTLPQAQQVITNKLSEIIRDPIVNVRLVRPRPVKVTIVGEVERPGTYTISTEQEGSVIQGQVLGARTLGLPSLTDAISLAGGIRESANIEDVEVIREQGPKGTATIPVDLSKLLETGKGRGDITLYPGDRIVIPEAKNPTPSEIRQQARSTLTPNEINVNFVGEVKRPGQITLQPNTPLSQALLAAGGFDHKRAKKANVSLIRLNDDGTTTEREIPVDFTKGINPENNPALRNGDIVVVERSTLTEAQEDVERVTGPLQTILNILNPFF